MVLLRNESPEKTINTSAEITNEKLTASTIAGKPNKVLIRGNKIPKHTIAENNRYRFLVMRIGYFFCHVAF